MLIYILIFCVFLIYFRIPNQMEVSAFLLTHYPTVDWQRMPLALRPILYILSIKLLI